MITPVSHSPLWTGPLWTQTGGSGIKLLILAEKFPGRDNGLLVGTGLDAEFVGNYVDGTLAASMVR